MKGDPWWRWRLRDVREWRRPTHDVESDVRDEVEFHLEQLATDLEEQGMEPEAARRTAELRFGQREVIVSELLAMGEAERLATRRSVLFSDIRLDVRFALRGMARRPGFTALLILTLALGIGANTAIFTLANWVLLRSVPGVRDPESLVTVTFGRERFPDAMFPVSHVDQRELAEGSPAFASLAGSLEIPVHAAVASEAPRRLTGELISAEYAGTLGLVAQRGRLPDGDASQSRTVMISDRLWSESFDRSTAVIGQPLTVNGKPFTVVGIAPRGYRGTQLSSAVDIWIPVTAHPDILPLYPHDLLTRRSRTLYMRLVGRLGPGATANLAETQLRAVAARALEADPRASLRGLQPAVHSGFGVAAYQRTPLGTAMRILGGAVGFLLLLACANAANLLLVRASGRTSELAVRRAIGASRARLVRQMLTESMLLALSAGALGVAVALGAVRLFEGQQMLPGSPPLARVELDTAVLGFALALSLLTGVLFSLAPVLTSTRQGDATLRHGTRAVAGGSRLRDGLVVSQIAISLALIVSAGLLLDTLRALRGVPLGFRTDGVVEVSMDPGTHGYQGEAATALLREFTERARLLPGVEAAGLAWAPVLGFIGTGGIPLRPEGESAESERTIRAGANYVTPGFLAAAGIELIAGRDFRPDEAFVQRPNRGVILVSESVARRLLPDGNVVGRHFEAGWSADEPRVLEVIGVFRDIRSFELKEADDDLVFEPFGQAWPVSWATLYVRGSQPPEVLAGRLQQMARELDASLPLYDVQPFARRIDTKLAQERMLARLTSLFAALALVLAAVGLYGVLAFSVQSRTREFGVRSALGARPANVRSMVMGEALRTAALGITLGLFAGTQAARVVSSRLWGVQPLDFSVFTIAAALLLVTALLASWIPAWRATRVDPTVALRAE